MSFNFEWPSPFSPSFHAQALSLLTSALNRGPKPKVIADDIEVTELNMGSVPPDLEILEIGELGRERFRGIFRLTYAGDAHVVVRTRVQVNPLSGGAASSDATTPNAAEETFTPFASGRGILFAATPLIVPMRLTLSHVRLRAIIVLVVSKTKGITLVFKNDPLESVQVSSTFDSVAVVAKYLQQEIEGQLKEVFREDLPGIIHRLSQTWLSARNKATEEGQQQAQPGNSKKPEQSTSARSRKKSNAASAAPTQPSKTSSSKSLAAPNSPAKRPASVPPTSSAPTSSATASGSAARPGRPRPPSPTDDIPPPLSDYYQEGPESYDPTYGLREDEVRVPKDGRGFRGLKGLRRSATEGVGFGFAAGRGLGGLLDDSDEGENEVQEEEQDEQDDADAPQAGGEEVAAGEHGQDEAAEGQHEEQSDQEGDEGEGEDEDVDDDEADQAEAGEPPSAANNDDFSRFGYPPPDAEFNSEAFELASLAPRSVFDDEEGRPSRNKTIKARSRPAGSTRSAGNASTAAQRVNARRAVEDDPPPAIRHATAPSSSLLMPGLARSNSSSSSSILSGRSPLLASTGPSSIASRRTSPANSANLTPSSSSSSRPPSRPRPRVFHSSSLLQLYQPSSEGIDHGDEATSSSWGGGSATIRGPRSSRGATTLRPPRSEGSRSAFMDGSQNEGSEASPAASQAKAKARRTFQLAGKGQGVKKEEEARQPLTTSVAQQYYQMSLSEDEEEDEADASEASRDDSDDQSGDVDDQSHSRTHSLSNSGASGTLATLEPEAMASDYNSHWGGGSSVRVRR